MQFNCTHFTYIYAGLGYLLGISGSISAMPGGDPGDIKSKIIMEKISLLLLITVITVGTTYAQNSNPWPLSGNVGIGTDNPMSALDVLTPINSYVTVGANTLGYGQFAGIHFGFRESNIYYRKSAMVFERQDDSARGKIHFLNNGSNSNASAGLADSRLTIQHDGKVGIGTQSPGNILELKSEIPLLLINGSDMSNYNGLVFQYNQADFAKIRATAGLGELKYEAGVTPGFGGSHVFTTDLSERMRITPAGNVLIGKSNQSNASYRLDVLGKVRSDEIVVNSTGADFVFEDDYKLRSLAETEDFIKQNKHLPEISPAREMVRDGIKVGEMNAKLLQKIEELTLYLIEQSKGIKEQGAKINYLEGEIEKLKSKPYSQ